MKKTPLNQWHHQHGARMVDFLGWEMPIQYEGIIAEHMSCRHQAALFDVSHMGELHLEGPDALHNLQVILPNDFSQLSIGQVKYSPMLFENGTCVDDLSVYRLGDERFLLCVNASNIEKDYQWIKSHLQGQVTLTNKSTQTGQIAIQGPDAVSILEQLVAKDLSALKYWWFDWAQVESKTLMLARMGYTGEDGFEIFCDEKDTQWLWEKLLSLGAGKLKPAGLGCRDTLRLEVAFPLYGHELDEVHNVASAGLDSFIKLHKPVSFIGKQALIEAKETGLKEKLARFVLQEKGIPREGYQIQDLKSGEPIGQVASGSLSPITGKGIGMGYLPLEYAKAGTRIGIQIRNRVIEAETISGAFLKTSRKK